MKERIRELALQVGAGTPQSLYGRTDYIVMTEFELEKFAQLIVQECLDILEDEDTHDVYGQPIRLATIRIKKLFGVQE